VSRNFVQNIKNTVFETMKGFVDSLLRAYIEKKSKKLAYFKNFWGKTSEEPIFFLHLIWKLCVESWCKKKRLCQKKNVEGKFKYCWNAQKWKDWMFLHTTLCWFVGLHSFLYFLQLNLWIDPIFGLKTIEKLKVALKKKLQIIQLCSTRVFFL
jgi:hypothetical protein